MKSIEDMNYSINDCPVKQVKQVHHISNTFIEMQLYREGNERKLYPVVTKSTFAFI